MSSSTSSSPSSSTSSRASPPHVPYVVLLGAGYGTRLNRGIRSDAARQWRHLLSLPKPLLPLAEGRALIDLWINWLATWKLHPKVAIVHNARHALQWHAWQEALLHAAQHDAPAQCADDAARAHPAPPPGWITLVNDGTVSPSTRLGAVADVALGLEALAAHNGPVLVVAGDTLPKPPAHVSMNHLLNTFVAKGQACGGSLLACYRVGDDEVPKRGILVPAEGDPSVSHKLGLEAPCFRVRDFLEKPQPTETTSRWACPAFYYFDTAAVRLVRVFLQEKADAPLAERDAPGKFVAWLVRHHASDAPVYGQPIAGRYDVGSLSDYVMTRHAFERRLEPVNRACIVKGKAHARVGFMGNPSDGFHGATLAFPLPSFWAEVSLWPSPTLSFVPHPVHDADAWTSVADLDAFIGAETYSGGVRLLKATVRRFFAYAGSHSLGVDTSRLFTMKYDTNIPRQVGLGGSSAIVTAAWRALMAFFGLSAANFGGMSKLPTLLLRVETEELGITAGLQDRVVQVMNDFVFMDFDAKHMDAKGYGVYERLGAKSMRMLPPSLFVAWCKNPTDSGGIHSDVRVRWRNGDAAVCDAMQRLAGLTREARSLLLPGATPDHKRMYDLMNANFDIRLEVWGQLGVHPLYRQMVMLTRQHGGAAKFTGSGGAIVGYVHPNQRAALVGAFTALDILFLQITPDAE